MKADGKLLTEIIDKQFEIIGEVIRFENIPDDGLIEVGKKKKYWYEHYKFTKEQEEEWVKWMKSKISGTLLSKKGDYIEMRYGLIVDIKKEGL